MTDDVGVLCLTAASIGLVHTLLGPDHYLPFVAMARAGRWSLRKTVVVTILCGVGHVLSSVILGVVGICLGLGVFRIEGIESFRGELAGWLLLAFGLVYSVWGVRRALRHRPHSHWHTHADGTLHTHTHVHTTDHLHVHPYETPAAQGKQGAESAGSAAVLTPWVLFTIFLFGPCELLIPVLMYPAAKGRWGGVALVTLVFAATTLLTMVAVVVASCVALARAGASWKALFGRFERYGQALMGLSVLACGVAVKLGL